MRWSRAFIPTLRDDPSDAEAVSHKLLVRAGFIRQLMAGVYSLAPLGVRVCQKIMKIAREEMNGIGGQDAGAGFAREVGKRAFFRTGSPVRSSRFG